MSIVPQANDGNNNQQNVAAATQSRAITPNGASRLVSLVEGSGAEFFHDPRHTTYVALEVNGHREVMPLASQAFQLWLAREARRQTGGFPSKLVLDDAVEMFTGKALYDGPECEVFIRLAWHEGRIYLDLGDDTWRAVEIDANGWQIVDRPPVYFRRPRGMRALPEPQRDGDLTQLREILNLNDEASWRLIVAWLLACLRPAGPYPLLLLSGEQGSAKSTTAEALRSLVDPHQTTLRSLPRNDQDLAVAGDNSWILTFDNLSTLKPWLSDALCRVSTGASFATRKLYTNGEEYAISVCRPMLLNGIASEIVDRPDLLDRALSVELPRIDDDKRRTMEEIRSRLDAARPLVLGALLDAVAHGLRELPNVEISELPRMADFVRWVEACGPSLGWERGSFAQLYRGLRAETDGRALDLWEVMPCLRKLIEVEPNFEGTVALLHKKLTAVAEILEMPRHRGTDWPANAKALATQLRRYSPNLRRSGIEIQWLGRFKDGCRVRITQRPVVGQAEEVNALAS
jgi:hypothetical protein